MTLGRYGVGAKAASIWMSDHLQIETVRGGVRSAMSVDWKAIEKAGRWLFERPSEMQSLDKTTGTTFIITPLHANRGMPRQSTWERLALTFMPGLANGLQIKITANTAGGSRYLEPASIPMMSECVEDSFDVDGRRVRIRIGIKQDGVKAPFDGFALCYGHRCLKTTDIGTGELNSSRMTGIIELGEGWTLNTFKDGVPDIQPLAEPIFSRIRHLLEKADQMARVVACEALLTKVEAMFNQHKDTQQKEKRPGEKGQAKGTVKGTGTRGRRRNASHVDPKAKGSVDGGQAIEIPGMKLFYKDGDGKLIGYCSRDNALLKVWLDRSHPTVKMAAESENAVAISCLVTVLLASHDETAAAGQQVMFVKGPFIERYSTAVASYVEEGALK